MLMDRPTIQRLVSSKIFWSGLVFKLILGTMLASTYLRDLFIPFVKMMLIRSHLCRISPSSPPITWPESLRAESNTGISVPSTSRSSITGTEIVALVLPARIVTVPLSAVKSLPEVAVPLMT